MCWPWRWTTRWSASVPRWTCSRRTSASTDRKSTRLNSSHLVISYAVFCLKKKKKNSCLTVLINLFSQRYEIQQVFRRIGRQPTAILNRTGQKHTLRHGLSLARLLVQDDSP